MIRELVVAALLVLLGLVLGSQFDSALGVVAFGTAGLLVFSWTMLTWDVGRGR